ncbi:MAG: ABC transporter ATP-binding protein [Bacteroidales bacterium]|nr:ABC transporter ATP-binding protein [Bacteroidales bacterium]
MTENDFVIELSGISKKYKLFNNKQERMKEALHPLKKKYHKEFYALTDIDLQVKRGEILGIVGMNGSGKSTLLKIIAGIIPPTSGDVTVHGNVVPLLELGAGFNPEFTGLENIYFYNSIIGYSRKQTDEILDEILDFAEIGDFIHQPIKTYSSGMKARLSFAVSVNINPDILIVDEILSVGDELFRRKSFAKIEEFFKAEKTILFVSHSEANINQLCSRAVMMNQGRIVLDGPSKFVTMNYSKFMFSNPTEKLSLLEEFKHMHGADISTWNNTSVETPDQPTEDFSSIPKKSSDQAYLIPNFTPKSTVFTYNGKLHVHDLKIETIDGVLVNALVQHDDYYFSYIVDYQEDAGHINYGIAFKTEQGVPLSWRIFPEKNKYLNKEAKAGDSVLVKWKFKCLFMPGTYFINTGIRRHGSMNELLLFRGADMFVFRVIGGDQKDMGGLFDAGISLSLSSAV